MGRPVRVARVPMGGWVVDGQAAPRHHEAVPEESSEDEMPPHIHKVSTLNAIDITALLACAGPQ